MPINKELPPPALPAQMDATSSTRPLHQLSTATSISASFASKAPNQHIKRPTAAYAPLGKRNIKTTTLLPSARIVQLGDFLKTTPHSPLFIVTPSHSAFTARKGKNSTAVLHPAPFVTLENIKIKVQLQVQHAHSAHKVSTFLTTRHQPLFTAIQTNAFSVNLACDLHPRLKIVRRVLLDSIKINLMLKLWNAHPVQKGNI
jgi:hypothetical protein